MNAYRAIIEEIKRRRPSREEVEKIKARVARQFGLDRIPANSEILSWASEQEKEMLLPLLRKKPVRTLSGIAVVAVMSKPMPCPGECIYCPRGENAPQSYTGFEPASLRAKASNYNPYEQVKQRLTQLRSIGHAIDKVEIIVMGGTFPAQSWDYQQDFVKNCLDALSNFPYTQESFSSSVEEAQRRNEVARVRCVGLTFETRPDFSKERHVRQMLTLGATRVELGVQTLSDEIYKRVRRGHTLEDVVEATRLLKDAGIKVGYHMMPGLFSTPDEDFEMFREIFTNPDFKPDTIKIYPTLVVEGTELYDLYRKGKFKPYDEKTAAELIAKVKSIMPKWIRTMRIQRDIPANLIVAGVKKGHLAELVQEELRKMGKRCRCIRCRDIGHLSYKYGVETREEDQKLMVEKYRASQGTEVFLSIEDVKQDALIAYLRLRFPDEPWLSEVQNSALVRELRVLGEALPIGKRDYRAEQHRGYGRILLKEAERLASEEGFKKLLVLSAIGTRAYYARLGYTRESYYMAKLL